jgi:uncharacterized protein YdeI (YjbR/CyaY-like superfamily)
MAMLSKRKWPVETKELRGLLRDFPFTEEMKWGKPCFLLEGKNVVLIQGFNEYIALMFFKGALLKDPKKLLSRPGEHQSVRQLRFVDLSEIQAKEKVVKAYVAEAIELPEELERKFKEMPALKRAFYALTPGRQKGYIFHFSGAKQAKTREARIEQYAPRILQGLGMMDRA